MGKSVLLVTARWTRDGGVATHVMASAAALARAGVEVHVLAARDEVREPLPGIVVHPTRELFNAELAPERRIGDVLSVSPSVIHTHQFDDPSVTALFQRHAPLVASAHGFSACTSGVHYFRPGQECQREHGPGCVPNLLLRGCAHTRDPRWLPRGYRRAGEARASLQRADLAISYSSVIDRHLAINGVRRRVLVPLFSTVPTAHGSGHEHRRRVVFAGRVVRPKGVAVLLRALRAVEGELRICGDGSSLPAMRRLAARLGVQERVTFAGWLGPEQLAHELAEASVVAIPSLWPEPFGLVGIEAQAAGRPVVVSATGGVSDWLEDGRTGICVPPGDADALAAALSELLCDPDRQVTMGAAGRHVVTGRFTEEHHVTALLDAYASAQRRWRQNRPDADASPRARRAASSVRSRLQ
jgi:glycosyltransferase involved in cell wall biosynthesis